MITRSQYLQRWRDLHGNAEPGRIVRGWLNCAYALARPLAALRVSPDLVSLSGVVVAIAAVVLVNEQPVVAAALVIASLILDGLDGAVAVLRKRESSWGGVVDGFLDRIGEALWAIALVIVGVPVALVLVGWIAAMVQEYQRARLGSLYRSDDPIAVTICERPVRALLIAAAILMSSQTLPFNELITPTLFTSIWIAMQTVSAVQVWTSARILR